MKEGELGVGGVAVNLPMALLGKLSDIRLMHGADKSLSNRHWAIFSGTSDLAVVRKCAVARTHRKLGEDLRFDEPWDLSLGDPVTKVPTTVDIRNKLRVLYENERYALAGDAVVLNTSKGACMLVGALPVVSVGGGLYQRGEKEMRSPFCTTVDPSYYFAFREMGFSFLVGPDEIKTERSTNKKGEIVEKSTPYPALTLLTREVEAGFFELRGCLIGLSGDTVERVVG